MDGIIQWEETIRRLIRYFNHTHVLIDDPYSLFNASYDELMDWFEMNKEESFREKQNAKGSGWKVLEGNA